MKQEDVDRMFPRIIKEYSKACDLEQEQSKERFIIGKHAFLSGMMSPEQQRANVNRMAIETFDGMFKCLASNLKEGTISRALAEATLDHIDIFIERANKRRTELGEKYAKDMAAYRQAQQEAKEAAELDKKRGRDDDEYIEIDVSERHKCGGKGQSHVAKETKRVRKEEAHLYS